MSSQNINRKHTMNIGIGLLVAALILFLSTLFGNHYKLTTDGILSGINNEQHIEQVAPAITWMLNKEYNSVFSFVHDFRESIHNYNKSTKRNKMWADILYNDYTFNISKISCTGWVRDNNVLLLSIIMLLLLSGAALFITARFGVKDPGIKHNGIFFNKLNARGWMAMIAGTLMITFYLILYFAPEYIVNWVILVDPVSNFLKGSDASQWFLYGFLYTVAVLVMGVRMMLKYHGNLYQQVRTASVMFFQTTLAFIIPEILVALNKPWYDFKNIWPLNYTFFYDWNLKQMIASGTIGWFMLIWGILLIIIAVPVFTYFFGKRWYCSWVCGCGGLAETLGDPFRQLSDKSLRAWKIERWIVHSVFVFAVVMTAFTLANYFSGNKILGYETRILHRVYGLLIGSIFAGVVGTGFYPLMGNRMWCRFGCPLAAYLGFVQRFKSRFRITTNGGQCISCGNCSTYCEMGIDVRAYAQRGENIVRSSCVGCGVCSAVCPRGVLKLENADEKTRFAFHTIG
ncbi:MAG: 4Fe-4S binding protein [Chitinophagales bacterium]|nr:4Fe-4S binding protein [Chitinophagales bacterium]